MIQYVNRPNYDMTKMTKISQYENYGYFGLWSDRQRMERNCYGHFQGMDLAGQAPESSRSII